MDWSHAFSVRELGVDSFYVNHEDLCQADKVDEGEREETEVDSLLDALLEEHDHVDAVGGEADEEEDGDDDGRLDSVKKILRLKADQVIGAVPWDGGVQVQDDAAVCSAGH